MPQTILLRLPPAEASDDLIVREKAARSLGVSINRIHGIQLLRRSVDARGKQIVVQMQLQVFVDEAFEDIYRFEPEFREVAGRRPVIVAGAGPAGLYAALRLIELGFCPWVIERGKDVRARRRDLAAMNKLGIVNPDSNYCYGEGGAGTYSDGKLYTRSTKRGSILRGLQWLRHFGAEEKILYEAHPHIGTNKLPGIIMAMREAIEACGGKVFFDTKLTDIQVQGDRLSGVTVNGDQHWAAQALVLATGHSARDIFELLHSKGIAIEAKPFALGVRVEHPQDLINTIQYRCDPARVLPFIGPASYSLVSQEEGRGVFSFCMCPGGIIAPASTEEGALVVNGWSPSKRNNPYANSGMVVAVGEKDFFRDGRSGPLAAMHYQKMVEERAWQSGGGALRAPAQRLSDFVQGKTSASLPECSYLPGVSSVNLKEVLPPEVYLPLAKGFSTFGKKLKGFLSAEAIVTATESRTSSPVRIPRGKDDYMHVQIKGLFPCAEGAGYAGGILSAAIDGENVANAIGAYLKAGI